MATALSSAAIFVPLLHGSMWFGVVCHLEPPSTLAYVQSWWQLDTRWDYSIILDRVLLCLVELSSSFHPPASSVALLSCGAEAISSLRQDREDATLLAGVSYSTRMLQARAG